MRATLILHSKSVLWAQPAVFVFFQGQDNAGDASTLLEPTKLPMKQYARPSCCLQHRSHRAWVACTDTEVGAEQKSDGGAVAVAILRPRRAQAVRAVVTLGSPEEAEINAHQTKKKLIITCRGL